MYEMAKRDCSVVCCTYTHIAAAVAKSDQATGRGAKDSQRYIVMENCPVNNRAICHHSFIPLRTSFNENWKKKIPVWKQKKNIKIHYNTHSASINSYFYQKFFLFTHQKQNIPVAYFSSTHAYCIKCFKFCFP